MSRSFLQRKGTCSRPDPRKENVFQVSEVAEAMAGGAQRCQDYDSATWQL